MAKKSDDSSSNSSSNIKNTFGLILLGIGVIFLVDNFVPFFDIGRFWPLILIVIGGALVASSRE